MHNYLIAHPEVLQEAMAELEKRQTAAEAEKHKSAVKEHAQKLFSSPRQVTLGNPNGNVTFVEFFDYNCGYCKRAMDDMLTLLEERSQPQGRAQGIPGARAGLGGSRASRQSPCACRTRPARNISNSTPSCSAAAVRPTSARALAVAKEVGMDMGRLEKDLASPEVKATLQEDFKLAEALGLNGTPSYVIGSDVVVGAIGLAGLQEKVNTARCGKPTC